MKEKLEIKVCSTPMPIIDENGNVKKNSDIYKRYISNNGKPITKSYYAIIYLYDDYYAVLDAVALQSVYNIILDDAKVLYKWGVICLKRDTKGIVKPFKEELVVPILYKYFTTGNSETIMACTTPEHFTYIELNKKSRYCGEQLVPAVLTKATPFDVEYKGFAECEIDDVIGYIPRDIKPLTTITKDDLLTREQVEYLISINIPEHKNIIEKINHLTGSKSLNLTRKP